MKELTCINLYDSPLNGQGRLRATLEESEAGPEPEALRMRRAMTPRITEDVGPRSE